MAVKNIKEMTNETRNESAGTNMLLKSYVMKLLLIILRNSSLNANFRDKLNQANLEIKVERICEYLKHNYTRPVKVEEIADYFKISRSYFHAVFLKYTGLTRRNI
jgi:AraC-like DNA-binding protein